MPGRAVRIAGGDRRLNNGNIPNPLTSYLFQMNLTGHEMAWVLKLNGIVFMVNDNVRYRGLEMLNAEG